MSALCPYSGRSILSCKVSDLCDCLEFPAEDQRAIEIIRARDTAAVTEAPDPREDEDCPGAEWCWGMCDQHQAPANVYDCTTCGADTHPDTDASPCEDHHVGPCCAPCPDCRDDAAEQAAMDERRGL